MAPLDRYRVRYSRSGGGEDDVVVDEPAEPGTGEDDIDPSAPIPPIGG